MQSTKSILGRALAILLALLLSVTALAAAIWFPATSSGLMLRLMQRYAPEAATHLPAAEYPAMTEMICAYLRGEQEEFQLVYRIGDAEYLAFHDREQQHMADVQDLFGLCRMILWAGAALSVVIAAAVLVLPVPGFRRAFRWGLIAVLAALTAIAALAVLDFDGLFVLFHHLAFVNDLWLLDPRTDLLVRLMPLEFFTAYAGLIGCVWLALLLALLGGSFLPWRKMKKGDENP